MAMQLLIYEWFVVHQLITHRSLFEYWKFYIDFVILQDTLFPYVREHLKKHVTEKWDDEEFKADLAKLKAQVNSITRVNKYTWINIPLKIFPESENLYLLEQKIAQLAHGHEL